MKRLLLIIAALLLTACQQEIQLNAPPPVVTSGYATPTSSIPTETPQPTPVPVTPTPGSFPPPSALPAGPVSLITIGDSLTQGDGDETGRGYPGRLLELVNLLRPDSSLTNFGQSGWTSDALIAGDQGFPGQLPRAVDETRSAVSQGRGAVVFIWIGSNDLWYLYEFGGDVTAEQEANDLDRFGANITQILIDLRSAGAQVIIALLDDQSKRPAALAGQAFPAITPDELARMSEQVKRYNTVIQEKADQYGALTVDFYNTTIFTDTATLSDDGNHPNPAGYDLITQTWYKQLITILP